MAEERNQNTASAEQDLSEILQVRRDKLAALRAASADARAFAEAMPAEWVERLALAGTPAHVRARVDGLFAAGVTSAVLIPAARRAMASSGSAVAIAP